LRPGLLFFGKNQAMYFNIHSQRIRILNKLEVSGFDTTVCHCDTCAVAVFYKIPMADCRHFAKK
jgi:hypothetical protein